MVDPHSPDASRFAPVHEPVVVPIVSPWVGTLASVPFVSPDAGTVTDHAPGAWLDVLVERQALHPDEAELARALHVSRQPAFVSGRVALRAAMQPHAPSAAALPVLRTTRGAPALPDLLTGSVSHKTRDHHSRALAMVAPRTAAVQHVGIDLERRPEVADLDRPSIASRILTATELDELEHYAHDALMYREQVLIYFAVKEAVYKAIDPLPAVQRYVGFREVALTPTITSADTGEMVVALHLPELSASSVHVAARWTLDGEWIIAQAWSW